MKKFSKLWKDWRQGEKVKITLQSWTGSQEGTIMKSQLAHNANSLVTVNLPEGNIDFKSKNLQVIS